MPTIAVLAAAVKLKVSPSAIAPAVEHFPRLTHTMPVCCTNGEHCIECYIDTKFGKVLFDNLQLKLVVNQMGSSSLSEFKSPQVHQFTLI